MNIAQVQQLVGKESGLIRAPDEVSTSDIRHWRELMEGKKEYWITNVAPPAMTLVWAMDRLWPEKVDATEPHEHVLNAFNQAGYTGVIGIALDQEYFKPVRLNDQLSFKVRVVSISSEEEEVKPARGYRIKLLYTFFNQAGELVSNQTYTVLKFNTLNLMS